MGRKAGKLKVEYMENQKIRNITFKRRKECLMKKAKELSTLCGVDTCMIIYDPDHETPTVWPPNDPDLVRRLTQQHMDKKSKDVVDGDKNAQLGAYLQKKALLVRAQIAQLKEGEVVDEAEQQEQLGHKMNKIHLDDSSTDVTVPRDSPVPDETSCVTSQRSVPILLDLFH